MGKRRTSSLFSIHLLRLVTTIAPYFEDCWSVCSNDVDGVLIIAIIALFQTIS